MHASTGVFPFTRHVSHVTQATTTGRFRWYCAAILLVFAFFLNACSNNATKSLSPVKGGQSYTLSPSARVLHSTVNPLLWQASLEKLSFIPFSLIDPVSGLIVTEWYERTDLPGERARINVFITNNRLRPDSFFVRTLRQVRKDDQWVSAPVADATNEEIENAILAAAREIQLNQVN